MSAGYPSLEKSIPQRILDGEWEYPLRPNKKYCEEFGKDYQEEMSFYRKQCAAVNASFKEACLDDVGLLGHPKADKVFDYAWQEGHSGGYHEIYNTLGDLADLLL